MTGESIVVFHSDKKPILFEKLYHFRNTYGMNNFFLALGSLDLIQAWVDYYMFFADNSSIY
jgi:hypothetical protein